MLIIKKKPSKLESFQKRFFFNIDELPYHFLRRLSGIFSVWVLASSARGSLDWTLKFDRRMIGPAARGKIVEGRKFKDRHE